MTETFEFDWRVGAPHFLLEQESSRAIGYKVYPAALLLSAMFEVAAREGPDILAEAPEGDEDYREWVRRVTGQAPELNGIGGKRILELGAGVCGLPTLVLRAIGARVLSTDLGEILPMLDRNLERNREVVVSSGEAHTVELPWGSAAEDIRRFLDDGWSRFSSPPPARWPDLIVASDVVYFEDIIPPLLDTLRVLTDAAAMGAPSDGTWTPPPIILAYVQRFKRAKKFAKLARRWFDVTCLPGPPVVDYPALNGAIRSGLTGRPPIIFPSLALHRVFCTRLDQARATRPHATAASAGEGGGGGGEEEGEEEEEEDGNPFGRGFRSGEWDDVAVEDTGDWERPEAKASWVYILRRRTGGPRSASTRSSRTSSG